MIQQNNFKEMLTNTQGELHGAQKETNFWHRVQILFFLEIFRKGSQPPSFERK